MQTLLRHKKKKARVDRMMWALPKQNNICCHFKLPFCCCCHVRRSCFCVFLNFELLFLTLKRAKFKNSKKSKISVEEKRFPLSLKMNGKNFVEKSNYHFSPLLNQIYVINNNIKWKLLNTLSKQLMLNFYGKMHKYSSIYYLIDFHLKMIGGQKNRWKYGKVLKR